MDDSIDYYSLLGVDRRATADEIKRAYRKLVFQYHPDRNPDNQAAADKLKTIMTAYDVLSNDESRSRYNEIRWPNDDESWNEKRKSGNGAKFSYDFKRSVEPEPKCPGCSAMGIDHVISRKGGSGTGRGKQFVNSPFQVVFCDQCGHVYGIAGHAS